MPAGLLREDAGWKDSPQHGIRLWKGEKMRRHANEANQNGFTLYHEHAGDSRRIQTFLSALSAIMIALPSCIVVMVHRASLTPQEHSLPSRHGGEKYIAARPPFAHLQLTFRWCRHVPSC